MPDDQEGRSEAQDTADGEQGGDAVLVRQPEGKILQENEVFSGVRIDFPPNPMRVVQIM